MGPKDDWHIEFVPGSVSNIVVVVSGFRPSSLGIGVPTKHSYWAPSLVIGFKRF